MIFRQQLVLVWQTKDGGVVTQFLPTHLNPAPVLGSLVDVTSTAQALSDAGLLAVYLEPCLVVNNSPLTGPYNTKWDRGDLFLKSNAGLTRHVRVIAPKAAIIRADGTSIDTGRSDVQAFLAAIAANLSDSGGSPLSTLLSAKRIKTTDPSQMV